jgi:hypothetical protein
MHVTQLFYPLFLREHDEVVEAMLPHASLGKWNLPQGGLPWVNPGQTPIQHCRANDCFRTFITTEGSPRSGSLNKR